MCLSTADCICISSFWGLCPQAPTGLCPWNPLYRRPPVPTLRPNPGYATDKQCEEMCRGCDKINQ